MTAVHEPQRPAHMKGMSTERAGVDTKPAQYALESCPGRLTASFPTFDTHEEATTAASQGCMVREGLPNPRVLIRPGGGGPWKLAPVS